MAAAGISIFEDQPPCCICLDVFTEPVTLPCQHDFCRVCITKHWDNADRCQCPLCNKCFTIRPELQVNTVTYELTDRFKGSAQETACRSSSEPQPDGGEVLCDVCNKKKAKKSCLVCLSSYCESHLECHQNIPGLRRHTQVDPVERLEDRMCKKYQKASEKLKDFFSKLQCVSPETTDNEKLYQ